MLPSYFKEGKKRDPGNEVEREQGRRALVLQRALLSLPLRTPATQAARLLAARSRN